LHFRNVLFAGGAVRAIDFDDCGFGPLLYDPAVMLSELHGDWGEAEYEALRAGLLAGYRRVRPLSEEHEAYVDTFIALRRLQDALWVLEWRKHTASKHTAIRGDWAGQARRAMAPVGGLLATGGRFPSAAQLPDV
jgi:Ser/Thr protein kinase RdoA (MazF antagonist)